MWRKSGADWRSGLSSKAAGEMSGQTVEHIVGYRRLAIFVFAESNAAHADTISHLALIKAENLPSSADVSGKYVFHFVKSFFSDVVVLYIK